MEGKYSEIYHYLNSVDKLNSDIYSNLLSIYGEELVNKVIDEMIDKNTKSLSKFDYYISKITAYDDSVSKSVYEAYGIDLSLIPCLTRKENIELATEIYYIIRELNDLMSCDENLDRQADSYWVGDRVEKYIADCKDHVKLYEVKKLYNKFLVKRNRLVEGNLRFVITVAKKFNINPSVFTEAIQYGNMGLMRAVEKFNPLFNVTFATYSYYWIRQSITRNIYDVVNPLSVPAYKANVFYHIKNVQRKLSRELDREPTDDEIAVTLKISSDEVKILRRAFSESFSLYNPLGEREDDGMFIDFVVDESASVDGDIYREELREIMSGKINDFLTDKERMVIERRFGFKDGNCETLEVIAKDIGKSRERVRQIEKTAMRKLAFKCRDLKHYLG